MHWILLLTTFIVAGMAQRITGIGFALIATPIAVVLIGVQAVSSVVVLGAISSVSALIATRQFLKLHLVVVVTVVTITWMLPMVFAVRMMSEAATGIAAGALVVAATILSALPMRGCLGAALRSRVFAGVMVAASAAMAGLAGPAGAAHGTAQKWGKSLVPNLQVLLLATTPFVILAHGWPKTFGLVPFMASAAAVTIGTVTGSVFGSRIQGSVALMLTRMLAIIGGMVALVGGLAAL